ncbi:hypothetical protein [Aestuariibacter salexigens]|uniref:hypothetical protein n=1 Tax=Aestuariibacter salexigens TaxID=226010 RepID=UPI000418C8BC|nr:hypothetical protein [Aestuariibacter salexigens]
MTILHHFKTFCRASLVSALLVSGPAMANMYGSVQVGGVDAKDDFSSEQGGSYKLAIGYELHKQWYAEFGYQQLGNGNLGILPATAQEANDFRGEMEGDALFVALLGKASGKDGELFYRLGLLKTDIRGEGLVASGETCSVGAYTAVTIEQQSFSYCAYDEAGIAGSLGIGYDHYVGTNLLIRFEAEHIRGNNGIQVNAAYIGLRYNFN